MKLGASTVMPVQDQFWGDRAGMLVDPFGHCWMVATHAAEPTLADRRELILQHFRWVAEREPSGFALHKLRKFTSWYTHGLTNGRKLRQRINDLPDADSFLQAVEDFFGELMQEERAA